MFQIHFWNQDDKLVFTSDCDQSIVPVVGSMVRFEDHLPDQSYTVARLEYFYTTCDEKCGLSDVHVVLQPILVR